jgi:molybdate transport repressor ModE-like protein
MTGCAAERADPGASMDLNHLRYFQAIAQSGSITAAAKTLHVSQPTLTVAMQNLEERLGTTLLLRDRSGVRLTATGEELLKHAAEVFNVLERAEQQIKGLERDDLGAFVIGCHESLGAYFLPPFMASSLKKFPKIELSLMNDSSANVQRAVLERSVHFGLVVNPMPHPDLVVVELFHDAMDLFVAGDAPPPSSMEPFSSRHPLKEEGAFDPALSFARKRLLAGPLIYAGRVSQCHDLIERLASVGLLPTRRLACGDLELVKSLALAGLGVAMLPRRVAHYGHEGKLVRLHPSLPFFPDTICLVYRADVHRTKAAMRLKDEIVAYGRGLDTPAAS